LENVQIKNEALRKFDIPVQVSSGQIGKLSLQIPITQIRSQPWVLKMHDFCLLLGPASPNCDIQFVEQYSEQKKGWLMDEVELHHKRQLLAAIGLKKDEELEEGQKWWGASFVSTISNNIQVLIFFIFSILSHFFTILTGFNFQCPFVQIILQNLHIRYEDVDENGEPYDFGVHIRHLHIQTTNHLWVGFLLAIN
jgi:hypothetical protein